MTSGAMYMGDPHRVAAITPSCRKRAKPKSAAGKKGGRNICVFLSSVGEWYFNDAKRERREFGNDFLLRQSKNGKNIWRWGRFPPGCDASGMSTQYCEKGKGKKDGERKSFLRFPVVCRRRSLVVFVLFVALTYFEFDVLRPRVSGAAVVAEQDVLGLQVAVDDVLAHHGRHGARCKEEKSKKK